MVLKMMKFIQKLSDLRFKLKFRISSENSTQKLSKQINKLHNHVADNYKMKTYDHRQ